MSRFFSLFKTLKLRQLLTVFFVGVAFLVTTACSPANSAQGASPNKNLPVQAGGQNNPHKGGGDKFLNSKTYTNPQADVKSAPGNQASQQLNSTWVIAATTNLEDNRAKLIYPGSDQLNNPQRIKALEAQANQAAEADQPVLTQTDPNATILEKTQKAFEDASSFLGDKAEEAYQRPEMQANPAPNE